MSRIRNQLLTGLLVASLPACGGGGGDGALATLIGTLLLPPASQCANCTTNGVDVVVQALVKDGAPITVATSKTDSQGRYNVSGAAPAGRTLIVVASVSQAAGLGGVEAVGGGNNTKDFDAHTQVACLASVFLTLGTSAFGDPGCTVRSDCSRSSDPNCSFTLDPSLLNNQRIANLEQAAGLVSHRVNLSDGNNVAAAACAVVFCTLEGSGEASQVCMDTHFS